jgi:NAD(P)-dependent dehydrogenase (short-subunit alcohol dehydrogenase family)
MKSPSGDSLFLGGDMTLRGTSVLVTGASRGLGRALASELGRRGARVVVVARDAKALDALVDEIRKAGGIAHALVADVGDKHAILPLAGAANALVGPIDVLVHNASALGPTPLSLLLDTDCEDLERVLEVNVVGPFRLSKALAGSMALRKKGVIVHLSSDASVNAHSRWGAYSASKAASDHLARIWAAELGERGVKVMSVDPGDMDTEMHAAAIPDADPATLARPDDVARVIADMIEHENQIENGARVSAGAWRAA